MTLDLADGRAYSLRAQAESTEEMQCANPYATE